MTDAADYIGKIRSKGLASTGITEQILARHHNAESGRLMIVASVKVAHIGKDIDGGKRQVDYIIDDIEVAPALAEEHVRELVRSFHYERRLEEDGPTLGDDASIEPKVADVLARGKAHAPHPFLPVDAADDHPICDVCGLVDTANPAHAAYALGARDDEDNDQPDHDTEHEANPANLFTDDDGVPDLGEPTITDDDVALDADEALPAEQDTPDPVKA